MANDDKPDVEFETFSARLIRREAKRRAALELSTTTPAGLESALVRITAEVTADAVDARKARNRRGAQPLRASASDLSQA
jgi:hypothetical protein